jgi:hypothetical protein
MRARANGSKSLRLEGLFVIVQFTKDIYNYILGCLIKIHYNYLESQEFKSSRNKPFTDLHFRKDLKQI